MAAMTSSLYQGTRTTTVTRHAETAKASAEKFGANLVFHDVNQMAAHPDVDLRAARRM
jgi:predicted dehydrogenase